MYRIGIGYDVHKLVSGRKLVLGGIEIPYSKGLFGHSDADVLVHSICDAVLGALCMKDIGKLFPDTDPAYKNISSLKLLKEVYKLIRKEGYAIGNIDNVIIAERPKMKKYINKMRKKIAGILNTRQNNISIKATTTEKLGFQGRGEGISSQSVALLVRAK